MVFVARPPAGPIAPYDLELVRAEGRTFAGSAEFLQDPENRARIAEYLTDVAAAYGQESHPPSAELNHLEGHSYGEMAQTLIDSVASPDEPVDLLILAFSVHDLRPGRQTAAYLSHLTPGEPVAFAICDQGSAAAFSGLRIAREYAASTAARRALLIVVEQAALPYSSSAPLPFQHQGVAMLFGKSADPSATPKARVVAIRQHPNVSPSDVAALAAEELKELTVGYDDVGLVVGEALDAAWPQPSAARVRSASLGQPSTGVWRGLVDELASGGDHPGVLVVADYDPQLRYLCLTALTR